jgi:hypothetical protein
LRGRNEEGGILKGFQYSIRDTFAVLNDIVVPKSENRKTLRAQPCIALSIVFAIFRMLSAIKLDNQSSFQANEIDNIATKGLLPAKLKSVNLPAAKLLPKQSLGVGRVPPQLAGSRTRLIHTPYPCLSPQGGKELSASPCQYPNPESQGTSSFLRAAQR